MATKKIAQTVITEDKFYTIAAANGKVAVIIGFVVVLLVSLVCTRRAKE